MLEDGSNDCPEQQERPAGFESRGKFPFKQHVWVDGLYARVPQQERPPGVKRTPLQHVFWDGL